MAAVGRHVLPFPIQPALSDDKALDRIAASLDAATREADDACHITPPAVWRQTKP